MNDFRRTEIVFSIFNHVFINFLTDKLIKHKKFFYFRDVKHKQRKREDYEEENGEKKSIIVPLNMRSSAASSAAVAATFTFRLLQRDEKVYTRYIYRKISLVGPVFFSLAYVCVCRRKCLA